MKRWSTNHLSEYQWLAVCVAGLTMVMILCLSCGRTEVRQVVGSCVNELTGEKNKCTANDVQLGILYNVDEVSCVAGEMVTLTLRAELVAGSAERYDIGMFVAEDGGDALTGSCYHYYLPPPLSAGGTCSVSGDDCRWDGDCEPAETCVGGYDPGEMFPGPDGGPFFNGEPGDASDTCGDIERAVKTYYDLNNGSEVSVPCIDTDGNGTLDIGTVVSWDNNKKDTCTGVAEAVPGTTSKCRVDRAEVANVYVQPGDIRLHKSAVPNSLNEPGGEVGYTFVVENTSASEVDVVIDSLVDVPFGDLTEYPGSTCELPQTLAFEEAYTCTLTAQIDGEPGVYSDTATAAGIDSRENPVSATAHARVLLIDVPPSVVVTKTASPTTLDEPGGEVTFTVQVANGGPESLDLTSLEDDLHGDLDDQGDCKLDQVIDPGGTYDCAFTATVSGKAGEVITDTVTATVADNESNEVEASDDATVSLKDVRPAITVTKTVKPGSVAEPGGKVRYTVKVTNLGTTGPVTLTELSDDIYGDLASNANTKVTNNTCELVRIDTDGTYQCAFTAKVTGSAGDSVTDVVTAVALDATEDRAEASDGATVKIVWEPPDTGAGAPVSTVFGSLATAGLLLVSAGAGLRRFIGRKS